MSYDNTLIRQGGQESQLSIDYTNPMTEAITVEAGYRLEKSKNDMDFFGEFYEPLTASWKKDTIKSNQFLYNQTIHVVYGTYRQDFGKFGLLTGLRAEQTLQVG